jgi:carboxyl-terminal processing protease
MYCAENPAPTDFKTFRISDQDYEKFLTYIKSNKFTYTTPLERSTKQLIEAAKNEKFFPELEGQLNTLKTKIEAAKTDDLNRFKPEIKEILEEQIAFNFGLNEGQAQISLTRDKAVLVAQKLLSNGNEHSRILSASNQ